jgi:phenylalanyl-tRNA synthetase beta chain
MRLLVSWVRDFVDVKASAGEIAETLGLRGFEVAAVEDLGDSDGVIDFEVTANRPDCLSIVGFAREIATVYDLPLRPPSSEPGAKAAVAPVATGESDRVKVTLEDEELCPRYAAAVAELIPAVTPGWMTARLQATGVRPISPVVDITNYVLMELGHPMHAFDLAMLAGTELRIRRANPGETAITIDGVQRTLEPDMLVIADARRPQAIAGVMGGATSEVSGTTRTVVFESAYFKPASVRRTSKRLGLKTEASARFERGADPNAPVLALQRAIALMQQIAAGRFIGPLVDRYPAPRVPKTLHLRRERLLRLLGLRVPDVEVERILRRLGLAVQATPDGWDVVAPTFRVDLQREVDLIEEVGRHHGFDKLEPAFPALTAAPAASDARILRDGLVRRALTAAGLSEAVTFGFVEADAARPFSPDAGADLVGVANPLSANFDTLRPSLVPGLLDTVAHNRRHGRRDVALFEIGARFTRSAGETRAVGIAWTGAAAPEHWSGTAREVDFFDVKGVVDRLCQMLGSSVQLEPDAPPYLVAGLAATVVAGEQRVGIIGQVIPELAEKRGAPRQDKIFVAEVNLDRFAPRVLEAIERTRPLARYPAVVRDLSIVVADTLPAEIIRGTIQAAADEAPAPLVGVRFFDRYQGKGVADGAVSLSVRLTFQASDRTLTDADVQLSFDRILAALVRQHGAVQR